MQVVAVATFDLAKKTACVGLLNSDLMNSTIPPCILHNSLANCHFTLVRYVVVYYLLSQTIMATK